MAKKLTDRDKLTEDIKGKEALRVSYQRSVPLLIKNNDTVELQKTYEKIENLSTEIFNLERQRFNTPKE